MSHSELTKYMLKTILPCALAVVVAGTCVVALSRCGKRVEPIREWRGKSVLGGYHVIREKDEIPEGFPEVEVDFEKQMLVAAFHGPYQRYQPEYPQSIDIGKIVQDGQVKIYVNKVRSPSGLDIYFLMPQGEVFHIISIPKSSKPVAIYENGNLIKTFHPWPEGGEVVDGLQATIKSDKAAYKLAGPISLSLRLRNVGNRKLYLPYHTVSEFSGYLTFLIEGGEVEEGGRGFPGIGHNSFLALAPKTTRIYRFDNLMNPSGNYYIMKTPGTYKVSAAFTNNLPYFVNGRHELWTGTVKSNTITIKVVK